MRAAVLWGPGDLRIQRWDEPTPRDGEVLLRVRAAGVCSSDVARVRVTGAYRVPLIPGHEFAGEAEGRRYAVYPLIACGACEPCRAEQAMCCASYDYLGSRRDGGWAEAVAVPRANLVPLPDAVDFETAAMCEPAAVGLHALRRVGLEPGDRVVVIGAGTIGLIVAQWARILGAATVALIDVVEQKLDLARSMGFELCANSAQVDPVKALGRFGLAVEAVGLSQTVNLAIDLAAPLGRVVLMGNIAGELSMPQERVSSILRKQLTIAGTWNSSLSGRYGNEWAEALAAMADGRLRLKGLISHRIKLDGLPATIEMMASRREPFQKVMVEIG
jgi:L-iditol 2-dehydrogenase